MSIAFLQSFLDWLSSNSVWSGLIIFLIAFSESLALVGLLVPGALFMFAIGTLISTGHLGFANTCLWAIAGAIIGDGVSYWLGNYYRDDLKKLWPLSRHPQLLERGTAFFLRHGGKSVLFGRFVGPLRPIIPAIAGMNNMPIGRFAIANVMSGFAWAPLYLFPGMAFGLSLTVASEVAGRLVVIVLVLLVLTLLLLWAARLLYNICLPHIDNLFFRIANWSHRHPVAGHIPDALIRPDHPEVRILSLLALLLLLATAVLIGLSQLMDPQSLLRQFDKLIHNNMQRLHTPGFRAVMDWVSGWGSMAAMVTTVSLGSLWLFVHHNRLAVWHLLAAFMVPWLLVLALQMIFPTPESEGIFPAMSVTMAIAVYGFMAVVLAREVPLRFHIMVYLPMAGVVFVISFAQLYLRQHDLSDVLTGLAIGAIWLSLIGIAYRRHVRQPYIKIRSITALTVVLAITVFLILPAVRSPLSSPDTTAARTISKTAWQQSYWQELPLYRKDLRDLQHHPLNLQWAGTLKVISSHLQQAGWQIPPGVSGPALLQWLNPEPDLKNLPVQPQVHDGRYDVLRLVNYTKEGPYVLRLWYSGLRVEQNGSSVPLWLGNTSHLKQTRVIGLTIFRTDRNFQRSFAVLQQDLQLRKTLDIQIRTTGKQRLLLINTP